MAEHSEQNNQSAWMAVLPLLLFLCLAGLFYSLLTTEGRDTSALPSALLNEPVPKLNIPPLKGLLTNGVQLRGMNASTFAGKVSVVNVFASCAFLVVRNIHRSSNSVKTNVSS